jgi:hypothetical protein
MQGNASVPRNVGGLDRTMRWIVGIAFLSLAFFVDMAAGWRLLAYLIGVSVTLTALVRYCPINAVRGVNTRHDRSAAR